MTALVFDIETNGLWPDVSVIWDMVVIDVETGAVSTYSDHGPGARLSEGLDRLQQADRLIAHNGIGYDLPVIHKITGVQLDRSRVWDTMVVGRLYDPERRDHTLASYGRELGDDKGEHSDWTQWSPEMRTYMIQDGNVTLQLYRRQLPQVADFGASIRLEHEAAHVISLQEKNGVCFDTRAALLIAAECEDERVRLRAELQRAFPPRWVPASVQGSPVFTPKRDNKSAGYTAGAPFTRVELQEFNPGSEVQIASRLTRKYGWKPKEFTDTGAPSVTEKVLRSLAYPEADALLRYIRADKMWTQIAAPPKGRGSGGWLHCVHPDGRIRGRVNSNGAVTGRMTHSRPNTANVDKRDKRLRSLWGPRPGWKLVGCDAEGLELRMLAHYLARWDEGAYAASVVSGKKEEGTDAHSRTQKIAGMATRDGAKTLIYAFLYGAGDEKLGDTYVQDARRAGLEVPRRAPSKIGKDIRARLETGIVGLGRLVTAVKAKAKKDKWLRGLDGRRIRCRSEHSALNTLLQGGGAVVMKQALALFHAWAGDAGMTHGVDFGYCLNVHDEVQIEAPEHLAETIGQSFAGCIREAGLILNVRCPLAGAYDIGANWAATH